MDRFEDIASGSHAADSLTVVDDHSICLSVYDDDHDRVLNLHRRHDDHHARITLIL